MIEINNLTTVKIDKSFLKKVAKNVLKGENKERAGLSVALVGQGRIKALNKKYRGKNRVTDVLAFEDNFQFPWMRSRLPGGLISNFQLGEIVICLPEVKKNAKKFTPLKIKKTGGKDRKSKSLTGFNTTFKKELARVLIHGILHLLGYNNEKSSEELKAMENKQEYYLSQMRLS